MSPANKSLEELWPRIAGELHRLAAALGLWAERRGDVVQEVYLVAYSKAPAELQGDDLRRWLLRVTANRCRLEHRRQSRFAQALSRLQPWIPSREKPHRDSASDQVLRRELGDSVEAALARLDRLDRELIVLRYFCEFDSREIGKMLSMPDGTVRSRLARARRQLAADLADWNEED